MQMNSNGHNGQLSGNLGQKKSNGGPSRLLIGIEADSRTVTVDTTCSLDEVFYLKNVKRPGLCNVQLKVQISFVLPSSSYYVRSSTHSLGASV